MFLYLGGQKSGYTSPSGITGSKTKCIFIRYYQMPVQNDRTNLHSGQQCMRVSVCPQPGQ